MAYSAGIRPTRMISTVRGMKLGRSSPDFNRPNMRIVLLGKSMSENSLVGNVLLGREAFDSEAPPDVVERVGGRLKDRHVMVINSSQLLQTYLSHRHITQTVRECVSLSDPGPHAFILVLQHNDFTEEDMTRVKQVLKEFSDEAIKRTIVITTDEATRGGKQASLKVSEVIQQLSTECGGGHIQLNNETEEWLSEIAQRLEMILKENSEEFLTCELNDYAEEALVDEDLNRSFASLRTEEDPDADDDGKHQETYTEMKKTKKFLYYIPIISSALGYTEKSPKQNQPKGGVSDTRQQRLNLVLCGSDETLKASVSKYIRKEKKKNLQINLVELPALNRLSEEEVMRHACVCVSRCDPGVHVFLLIIPAGSVTDEDKAEMENIQKIFSSRINKHLMVLIIQEKSMISNLNILHTSVTKTSIQTLGGHRFVLENSSQVPALLQDVEKMVQENNRNCYTTLMYLQDQVELERDKHRAEIEQLRISMMKTQSTAGVTHDDLRIVLLGKTGVGKSATGNTILRREMFESVLNPSSVTRECQKETSEFNRRLITVIDTPGLFDTGVDNDETWKEIVKCVSMAAPGPHVFLLVIQLGRFTQEEKDAVKMIQNIFGDKSRMYTIVLFTRGDDLGKAKIEDYVEQNDSLKNVIQQCGKRYHVFNNKETKDQTQVSELLDKIDWMLTVNGGSFYTNEMFQQVEKNIKEEQERIMKEKEEEIKRNEEELRAKYEAEIEQMKKENEREIQEMQNEMRRAEEEFKKREEEIKKETNETLRNEMQRKLEEHKKQIEEENERKEKSLGEMQQNFIKFLEEKHEKDKQKLKEKIQRETREQAEREFSEKLMKEVNKALEEAEAKLPCTAKRARDWNHYVPVLGGAAGGAVGGIEDIVRYIHKISKRQAQIQS